MKKKILLLTCVLLFSGSAISPADPGFNEGLRMARSSQGKYSIEWWGRKGWVYFVQHSTDLISWTYLTYIDVGTDATLRWGFNLPGEKNFLRLRSVEFAVADPEDISPVYAADFDGDGVDNRNEIETEHTDPFSANLTDTDNDGIPDEWERYFGFNPLVASDASADPDHDGQSNLAEYLARTNPLDWYNGSYPQFQVVGPASIVGQPGTYSAVVVEVRRNGALLANAPLRFQTSMLYRDSQISATANGTGLADALTTTTDANGRATVYYFNPVPVHPKSFLQTRVSVTASSADPNSSGVSGSLLSTEIICTTFVDEQYPLGTLGRSARNAVESRLVGRDPATALNIYSQLDIHSSAPVFVRNPALWCADLSQALTCVSPWNSESSVFWYWKAGTAITKRHIINANHFRYGIGTRVRFITVSNEVIERTVVGYSFDSATDMAIYTLDSDLPSSITPCKILPANYTEYLNEVGWYRPPVIVLDQERKAFVNDLTEIGAFPPIRGMSASYSKPAAADQVRFFEQVAPGDSGNPVFIIVANELAIVTCHYGSYGAVYAENLTQINAMITASDSMAGQNTGLHVQTVDLTPFVKFTYP